MKITVSMEEDSGSVKITTLQSNDLDDLYDVARFLGESVRAGGYSYVEDVGFLTANGKEVWGEGRL